MMVASHSRAGFSIEMRHTHESPVYLHGPPYGAERCYNGLRLALALVKRKDAEAAAPHYDDGFTPRNWRSSMRS